MKTQTVRLVDVFFLGPVMMFGGVKLSEMRHPILGVTLLLGGAATVIYNWKNYQASARVSGWQQEQDRMSCTEATIRSGVFSPRTSTRGRPPR